MTTIFVSQGKTRYVGGTITELTGKDISTATYTMALGTSAIIPPTTGWVAPDVSIAGATVASRVLKLLVTNTTPVGTWWVWVNVVDNPEIEPFAVQGPIITA
jgi:hypothetical protein